MEEQIRWFLNKNYENNLVATQIQWLHKYCSQNTKTIHKKFEIIVVVQPPKISSQEKERTRPASLKANFIVAYKNKNCLGTQHIQHANTRDSKILSSSNTQKYLAGKRKAHDQP